MQNSQVHTQHQIVEEILPENMSEEVTKQVINQFLPQRKRKPRVPKTNKGNPPKVIKLEPQASGSDTITTITGISEQANEGEDGENKEQLGEIIEQVEEGVVSESGVATSPEGKPKGEGKTPKDKSNSELKWEIVLTHFFAYHFHHIIAWVQHTFRWPVQLKLRTYRAKVEITVRTAGNMSHLLSYNQTIAQLEKTFGVETFQEEDTEEAQTEGIG